MLFDYSRSVRIACHKFDEDMFQFTRHKHNLQIDSEPGLRTIIADDPLTTVARGAGIAFDTTSTIKRGRLSGMTRRANNAND